MIIIIMIITLMIIIIRKIFLINEEPAPDRVQDHVTRFTQSIINEDRLHYIQSSPNKTRDSFTFDVTNGITHLDNLVFHFIIIPKVPGDNVAYTNTILHFDCGRCCQSTAKHMDMHKCERWDGYAVVPLLH